MVRAYFLLQTAIFLLFIPLQWHQFHHADFTLMTASKPNYLRKAPSPNTNTLEAAAAAAKSLQLCLTLCNPIDGSPPGSPVPGILQARTLEWVAISFSNA